MLGMAKPMPMLPPPGAGIAVLIDKLAVEVQQRAAGVAAVDGGIGLDEILQPFKVQAAAAKGRDNAGGGGLT